MEKHHFVNVQEHEIQKTVKKLEGQGYSLQEVIPTPKGFLLRFFTPQFMAVIGPNYDIAQL